MDLYNWAVAELGLPFNFRNAHTGGFHGMITIWEVLILKILKIQIVFNEWTFRVFTQNWTARLILERIVYLGA